MASSFGTGVTRTLDPSARSFQEVIFQKGKPPLDAELNLVGQIGEEQLRQAIQSVMPSGFLTDPTLSDLVYDAQKQLSNCFYFAPASNTQTQPACYANVNGWILPVSGSNLLHGDSSVNTLVQLAPAPTGSGSARTDMVFLEVWKALVRPNPATANKPDATHVWKNGNVQTTGTNPTDDLQDPTLKFETTKRVQLQYRIRAYGAGDGAAQGVDLITYPDGLDDPHVLAQGTATLPVGGMVFTNMADALGDPSLWRAGDGNPNSALGTVDGYVYAIPVCAVFRRNSAAFVAANSTGNPNQNGSFCRTPSTALLVNPLSGATLLTTCSLNQNITSTTVGVVSVSSLAGSGLDDPMHYAAGKSLFVTIDNEIVEINGIDALANTVTIISRGRFGTHATYHEAGLQTTLNCYNTRPDGLYADEVSSKDILDLRRAINPGNWDHTRLLAHNVNKLLQGDLHSTWKVAENGQTQGRSVTEVDYMIANSVPTPNLTVPVDGPDGIRTVFSDAAVIQRNVSLLLDPSANLTGGFTDTTFDTTTVWDVGASFYPQGFLNWGADNAYKDAWSNGSCIFLYTEGPGFGNNGARATFQSPNVNSVRVLTPREYWKEHRQDLTNSYIAPALNQEDQYPVKIRAIGTTGTTAEAFMLSQQPLTDYSTGDSLLKHPGPLYPEATLRFEYPFIVLGDILNDTFSMDITANAATLDSTRYTAEGVVEIDLGLDFDALNLYWTASRNEFDLQPTTTLAQSFLHGQQTLYSLLTRGGVDTTGDSSDLYLVLWGDSALGGRANNGAFKVVGVGTIANKPGHNLTRWNATTATRVVAVPLNTEFLLTGFNTTTGSNIHVQARSQQTTVEGGGGTTGQASSTCIVFTDILGALQHPWNRTKLGYMGGFLDVSTDNSTGIGLIHSKIEVNLSLQYSPSRGATSRIADQISRFAVRNPDSTYLRQAPGTLDPAFPLLTGVPANESFYDPTQLTVWNHLEQRGWEAGRALSTNYGGKVVSNTEQDREHELFVDSNSKTAVFRPFRHRLMTLGAITIHHSAGKNLLGFSTYPLGGVKDGLNLFTQTGTFEPFSGAASSGKNQGFPVPAEYMPKFGRQDIPYYRDVTNGAGLFLEGLNHLFVDSTSTTNPAFALIGGHNMGGAGGVSSMYFRTNNSVAYGASGTNIDGAALNRPFYEARKSSSILDTTIKAKFAAVQSSDFGPGLEGIQLPPYLGIARLYGVYEYNDYISPPGGGAAGVTYQNNRATFDPASTITNLLRKDANQQTLFIMQDGAQDLVRTGAHTYVIPSNVIDITKIPGYALGAKFSDYNYVVECVVFGFSHGWIDSNNYVLCRQYDAQGVNHQDGQNPQLVSIPMCIPAPAHLGLNAYTVYSRTPYQGDPYGTKSISVPDFSDYRSRYGNATLGQLAELQRPLLQYENGVFVPETPNPKAFEVLASLDFYTTMGTGKVGGVTYAGTLTDTGHLTLDASTRLPGSSSDYLYRHVVPRTYTEGQKDQPNQASLGLVVAPFANVPDTELAYHDNTQILLRDPSGQTRTLYGKIGPRDLKDWMIDAIAGVGRTLIRTTQEASFRPGDQITFVGTGTALDGKQEVLSASSGTVTITGVAVNIVAGSVPAGQVVFPEVGQSGNAGRFFQIAMDTTTLHSEVEYAFPGLGAGASTTTACYLAGTHFEDTVFVASSAQAPLNNQIIVSARVVSAGLVAITLRNPTANVLPAASAILRVEVLQRRLDTEATAASLARVIGTVPSQRNSIPQMIAETTNSGEILLSAGQAGQVGNASYVRIDAGILGFGVSTVTTGATTTIQTHIPINLSAGKIVYLTGFTGAGAANVNDKFWKVATAMITTEFTIDYDSSIPATAISFDQNTLVHPTPWETSRLFYLKNPDQNLKLASKQASNLVGGRDVPLNAGPGISLPNLTGMTERLPLGILCQDSDFLSESILNDQTSAVQSFFSAQRPLQAVLPLTQQGQSYTNATNAPGDIVGLYDGSLLQYTAYDPLTAPAGVKSFRLYRGESAMVLNNPVPGGPEDWTLPAVPAPLQPVLKGGILACRALLVRNYPESAFSRTVSNGDEIQMLILTQGVFGNTMTTQTGLSLNGEISPAGYGEGYAAAERYRLEGKPMYKDASRKAPSAAIAPAPRLS